jgi:hypothetical protein
MALVKGTNSYVTVEEAVTYFDDRLDVAAWTSASDDQKRQSLITATAILDDLEWTGVAVSDSQSLAFPRTGRYFDPRVGYIVDLPITTPKTIQRATFEVAYHLLNNDGLLDDVGDVKTLEVGTITLSDLRAASRIPGHVTKMIRPLLNNRGSSSWWRAN